MQITIGRLTMHSAQIGPVAGEWNLSRNAYFGLEQSLSEDGMVG